MLDLVLDSLHGDRLLSRDIAVPTNGTSQISDASETMFNATAVMSIRKIFTVRSHTVTNHTNAVNRLDA